MNKPNVGQLVYYKARGSADGVFPKVDRASIVTDVRVVENVPDSEKIQVRVCVFNPEGLFFSAWLYQGQEGGQWDWMFKNGLSAGATLAGPATPK